MKRRCLSVILAAVVLLLAVQTVPAAQADEYDTLRRLLIESCAYGEQADVSECKVTQQTLDTVYRELQNSGRLPWNSNGYRYINGLGDYVISFMPVYLEEAQYNYDLYEQLVAEAMFVALKDGMEQTQMALAVHDYLITHCVYDESLERNTGYDLLVNGTTVCAGYAMAYMDIMNRLGMECRYVTSEGMNHAWNLLKVDGSWYHVDLTWDDPSPNSYGNVLHTYFLLTDAEMLALEHYGWQTDIVCTDETFTDAFWKKVNSQICYLDGKNCVIRTQEDWTGYIRVLNEDTGAQKTLRTMGAKYINVGAGEYTYSHEGLSLWNNRLYFSTMDTVYSMAVDGTDVQTVYRYDASGNGKYIYGSFVENDTLYLTLADHDFNHSTLTVPLEASGYHVHSYQITPYESTCVHEGATSHLCACGLLYETNHTRKLEHSYVTQVLQEATCTQKGHMKYTCENCGDSYEADHVDINAHRYTELVIREANLLEEGVRRYTCAFCCDTYDTAIPRVEIADWLLENRLLVIGVLAGIPMVIGAVVLIAVTCSRRRKK